MSERFGDRKADRDALDRWITQGPFDRFGDGPDFVPDEVEGPVYVVCPGERCEDYCTARIDEDGFAWDDFQPPEPATCASPDCGNEIGLTEVAYTDEFDRDVIGWEWRFTAELSDGRKICEDCTVAIDDGRLSADLVWADGA